MIIDWKKQIPWKNYEWAEYACLNKDGTMRLFRDKPICMEQNNFWWPRYSYKTYERKLNLTDIRIDWYSENNYVYKEDWKDTLVRKK